VFLKLIKVHLLVSELYTHSRCLILIACSGQKLLSESVSALWHLYITCVVFIVF